VKGGWSAAAWALKLQIGQADCLYLNFMADYPRTYTGQAPQIEVIGRQDSRAICGIPEGGEAFA
jgi:hypothetical protein